MTLHLAMTAAGIDPAAVADFVTWRVLPVLAYLVLVWVVTGRRNPPWRLSIRPEPTGCMHRTTHPVHIKLDGEPVKVAWICAECGAQLVALSWVLHGRGASEDRGATG